MTALINSIRRGVPAGLKEIAQLGRTLWRRRDDILAFFDHHASNGPTEAINRRLEALRRNAFGFRNLPTTDCAHSCTAAPCTHWSIHFDFEKRVHRCIGRNVHPRFAVQPWHGVLLRSRRRLGDDVDRHTRHGPRRRR